MRKLLLLLIVPAFFACKEKDLTSENPATSKDNIRISVPILYDTAGVRLDTIYTNNLGLRFTFTEMSFAFSNYTLVESGDTVFEVQEPFLITLNNQERFIGRLTPGGYSGKYSLRLGLDSAQGFGYSKSLAKDEELANSDIFRADRNGIDQVVIKGKLFDPTNPLDTVGTIPFEFRLGTAATSKVEISDVHYFSVSSSAVIPFFVQINLWSALKDYNIYDRPKITTDPNNQFDLDAAIKMADDLQFNLF